MLAQQWQHARASVPTVLGRLLTLVDGVPGDRKVTADWTVADTLAHLTTITAMDVAMARQEPMSVLPVPGLADKLRATTVETVNHLNNAVLAHFPERRLPQLTRRLGDDVDALLAATEQADPERTVSWLGGADLPLSGLLAHLLNELNIHGWDIARGLGRHWWIDPRDATQFVDVFIAGIARNGYGRLLDYDGPARPGRISVAFEARGSEPVLFALTDGVVTLAPPEPRPDVRLRYDPATFNLMLFGRVHRMRAVLTGKLSVGGRRPWLLPAFMRVLRAPSNRASLSDGASHPSVSHGPIPA
jgi:uncharacterized protein (TIGR03083 family)